MLLNDTPYIRLRNNKGLTKIDYTACDIIGLEDGSSTAAARSYSTIIGVYTRSGEKVYLKNAEKYSVTTAGKHHPRAEAIAIYNGYHVINNVRPDVLYNVYFHPSTAPAVDEIINEAEERRQIIKELRANDPEGAAIIHAKVTGTIKTKKVETHQYKNGNNLDKYYCTTNFKFVSNITYEVNIKSTPYRVRTRTGTATTHKYNSQIVNIKE